MRRTNKYSYHKIIQQYCPNYGWEDVSAYVTDSQFFLLEWSDKPGPRGKKEKLLTHDLREYRKTGYPTRVVARRSANEAV